MCAPEDLARQMSERTDEDLYKMLYLDGPEDWKPEALSAAQHEWQNRNLPPGRVEQLVVHWEDEKQIANEPLGWLGRIGFFCLVGILAIPWAFGMRDKGYHKKFREACIWMGLGVLFWSLLAEALRRF